MQLRYRYVDRLSTATQRNALHKFKWMQYLKFKWMQYRNVVVGSETEIRTHRNADAVEYEALIPYALISNTKLPLIFFIFLKSTSYVILTSNTTHQFRLFLSTVAIPPFRAYT